MYKSIYSFHEFDKHEVNLCTTFPLAKFARRRDAGTQRTCPRQATSGRLIGRLIGVHVRFGGSAARSNARAVLSRVFGAGLRNA